MTRQLIRTQHDDPARHCDLMGHTTRTTLRRSNTIATTTGAHNHQDHPPLKYPTTAASSISISWWNKNIMARDQPEGSTCAIKLTAIDTPADSFRMFYLASV
mmetsp:Transcript_9928/g.16236  ORF Transcript_9928/g.16236 Transcript_9928/m.16236 type:complete len:102 (-) Transcript_9928:36-341(-)